MTYEEALKELEKLKRSGLNWFVRLRPNSKEPLGSAGSWLMSGNATEIASWFRGTTRVSMPNIGMHAGRNRKTLIDFDAKEGVALDPEEVRQAYGLPITPCFTTAHGGCQFLLNEIPDGFTPAKFPVLLPGVRRIDIKHGNSYSVMPPSVVDGKPYKWARAPWQTPIAEFPQGWLEPISQAGGGTTTVPTDVEDIAEQALKRFPPFVRKLWAEGRTSEDRSGEGYNLAALCVEHGLTNPTEIAAVVYTSTPHRDKFRTRPDGWVDAMRCATRALEKKSSPTQLSSAGTRRPPQLPQGISAAELARLDLPAPRFVVEGLLPEGLSVLAGKPKIGKSWLAMQLAICISTGAVALGRRQTNQGAVVYLALEDNLRRLKSRLKKLLPNGGAPADLTFYTTWPALDEGGLELLDKEITANTSLIVVDTLQRFRGRPRRANGNAYAEDIAALAPLQTWASERRLAVLVLHHLNKRSDPDPLDLISGSIGIPGTMDTNLVLMRERSRADATLYVGGRDVLGQELALGFDQATCTWSILGDAAAYRMSAERAAILAALSEAGEPLSPKELATTLGGRYAAVSKLLQRMLKDGELVMTSRGKYTVQKH